MAEKNAAVPLTTMTAKKRIENISTLRFIIKLPFIYSYASSGTKSRN
jgi:hypothetical protein